MKMVFASGKSASRLETFNRKAPPVSLIGRCMLPGGEEFSCQAYGITSEGCDIIVKAQIAPDTPLICYFDNIGIMRGTVRAVGPQGLHLVFDMNEQRRIRVAARIQWHEARAAETAEQRAAPRIVPMQRDTEVRLGEQLVFKARIIDMSISGVAVNVEGRCRPFVGSLVQIGKRFAVVVRNLENGFAAEFKLPFTLETFNQHVVL